MHPFIVIHMRGNKGGDKTTHRNLRSINYLKTHIYYVLLKYLHYFFFQDPSNNYTLTVSK